MFVKRAHFGILFALVAGLAACSPPAASNANIPDGVTVRSIAEIVSTPFDVTNFTNDGSATLSVQSSIPVACTIVYGKTLQFGAVASDQDMAGGTHTDHHPVLSALEPEAKYYYRFQGVDASGVLYISDVMTFTTPPRIAATANNLASAALGAKIIGYSSAYGNAAPGATWGITNAFDDNPNTAWSSAGDGDRAWVEVKLAKPARVTAVSFHSRSMADGSAITQAFIVTTENGQLFGPFEVPDANQAYKFEVAFDAQVLKFELSSTTGGNTGATDIAVYGEFLR